MNKNSLIIGLDFVILPFIFLPNFVTVYVFNSLMLGLYDKYRAMNQLLRLEV